MHKEDGRQTGLVNLDLRDKLSLNSIAACFFSDLLSLYRKDKGKINRKISKQFRNIDKNRQNQKIHKKNTCTQEHTVYTRTFPHTDTYST